MSELVVIEKSNIVTVFTESNAIDPILKKIADDARSIVPDVSTPAGRKNIASIAYKVAQAKTYLDGLGKDLVDEMKEVPKKIDANRKLMRDFLDNLKDEVRLPLTEWEEEQARIEAEKLATIEAEKLAKQVESDHEIALLLNAEFDRKLKEAEIERIRLIKENEERIAKEAEEKAKREAEAQIKKEREENERKIIEARLATERAERETKEAEARAIADKERAVIAERVRLENIELQKQREIEAREADVNHKRKINKQIINDLIEHSGLNEEQAKQLITCIVKKQISNITINY